MGSKDLYGVQNFATSHNDKLVQGRFIECRDADDARATAQRQVETGRADGAAAFLRPGYRAEFDDSDGPITLAVYGRVPPGVEDAIPF